jgi:subfamily B ATP-binding cassette protein MsbA
MRALKRLITYSRPYWWRIAIAALASSLVGSMDGIFAYLSGRLVKQLFVQSNWHLLQYIPFAIIVIFLVRGLSRYTNDYFIKTAGQPQRALPEKYPAQSRFFQSAPDRGSHIKSS